MRKLSKKIFWTLFLILSTFLITILFIFNYQSYYREKINIEQNLFRMNNLREPKLTEKFKLEEEHALNELIEEERYRKFMDAKIYTILLDDNNRIFEIISHTEEGVVENRIKEEALKIINSKKEKKIYIGNLYFNHYAYKYEANHYITLMDIHEISENLLSSLRIALFLFLFAEVIIVIISKVLASWIIKPVEKSFNNQKQFIADASHELKTPLSVIMACAETLENNPKEKNG